MASALNVGKAEGGCVRSQAEPWRETKLIQSLGGLSVEWKRSVIGGEAIATTRQVGEVVVETSVWGRKPRNEGESNVSSQVGVVGENIIHFSNVVL